MSCAWQQEKFLCQFDGIPAYMEQAWSYGASALDVALYDRVDVVRGATGLLTGSGNPLASINLVRKHAVSRDFTGTVSVGGGDFNKTRGVADVTVPLRPEGTARARVVGVYRDGESDMERYSLRKKIGSAIVDFSTREVIGIGHRHLARDVCVFCVPDSERIAAIAQEVRRLFFCANTASRVHAVFALRQRAVSTEQPPCGTVVI